MAQSRVLFFVFNPTQDQVVHRTVVVAVAAMSDEWYILSGSQPRGPQASARLRNFSRVPPVTHLPLPTVKKPHLVECFRVAASGDRPKTRPTAMTI
jgi:hypothetical protein